MKCLFCSCVLAIIVNFICNVHNTGLRTIYNEMLLHVPLFLSVCPWCQVEIIALLVFREPFFKTLESVTPRFC